MSAFLGRILVSSSHVFLQSTQPLQNSATVETLEVFVAQSVERFEVPLVGVWFGVSVVTRETN